MRYIYISIIILLGSVFHQLKAQEQLLPLQIDPSLNNYHRSNQLLWKKKESTEPMFLPFFDDFNQAGYRPNADLWEGDNVYINKKFQLFPPNIGVATFDAMDGSGNIYSNASQYAFPADTLSSLEIRLDSLQDPTLRPLLIKDSVYFSFYYQPQGRGNAPEEGDILNLEFYSPPTDQWENVWSSEGMTLDTFLVREDLLDSLIIGRDTIPGGSFTKQVFIAVTDSAKFFHSGFRFRFHNHASLAGNSQPDWQSNCDHWNIDMVWLDRDRTRTDSSYRKISFVNDPPSMIKRYRSMPYRQYRNDPTNSMMDSIRYMFIRNMDNVAYLATYKYTISNQTTQDSVYQTAAFPADSNSIVESIRSAKPPIISYFSIYNELFKTFKVTHIINDIGLTGVGDTIESEQVFANYYAYDDGTPEAGYGMSARNGKAAIQFQLNTKDTLRRIQMYFNPTLTSANEQYFNLMVWKNIEPEEVIYKKRVKVTFSEGLYNFYTFDLDTSIVLANEFYIGFQQLYDENLNIGFDYALDSKQYLYYNIGVGWIPTIYTGSLMMRPLFGEVMPTATNDIKPIPKSSFVLYPNPVNGDIIHLDWPKADYHTIKVEIYNITGQLMLRRNDERDINVSELGNGVYLVKMTDTETGENTTQKMIKRKL
ncbi:MULTISPECIES: T9SS type A sorting domain-containing protein [unclassified Lentimicrobium]|uniref:T9SS type A sorting domain-containing protein n=1 Tax=unclassified Lentimicrobium TaxID=2677434 RepID=UPI001553927B|nr:MULTISPECIES: T9SS type A sorting domain-containing protein [unclassified Lentimicrobium]NPD44684.1 T9SS type A sorting domain-containing protein [Lentimicrobium sp. S6]NPD83460.1 T9SS type A sorting domain-containing protein [Lentimicrobium sp. L6]